MLLHCVGMKRVATGGDLSGASTILLEKSAIGFKQLDTIVERVLSDNPNPRTRIRIGRGVEIKGVLGEATISGDYAAIHDGTYAANVLTMSQGISELDEYDVRFICKDTSDNDVLIDITNVHYIPETDLSIEPGKETYLPFTIKTLHDSEISIDESAGAA